MKQLTLISWIIILSMNQVIGSFPYNKALERLRAFNNENNNRELYNRPYSNKKFDDVSYLNANKERYPSLYLYSILKKKNVSIPRAGKRHFNTDEEIFGSIEKKNIYMPRVGRGYDWLTGESFETFSQEYQANQKRNYYKPRVG